MMTLLIAFSLVSLASNPADPPELIPPVPGEIFISDNDLRAILAVDPETRDRRVVSSPRGTGPPLTGSLSACLLVSDRKLLVCNGSDILSVDIVTGDRNVYSGLDIGNGPAIDYPRAITRGVVRDGRRDIIIGQRERLLRIDPKTRDRTVISSNEIGEGVALRVPTDLGVLPNGLIIVTRELEEALIAVDPVTGDRFEVSSPKVGQGPLFGVVRSLDVRPTGEIFVGTGSACVIPGNLFEVDYQTGLRRRILDLSSGRNDPFHMCEVNEMAALQNGHLLVSTGVVLFAVNPRTGESEIFSGFERRLDRERGSGPRFDYIAGISVFPEAGSLFQRGDLDGDRNRDLRDVFVILHLLFLQGEELDCPDVADVDDSGALSLADGEALLRKIFLNEGQIPPPYDSCGSDPTVDDLECDLHDFCDTD